MTARIRAVDIEAAYGSHYRSGNRTVGRDHAYGDDVRAGGLGELDHPTEGGRREFAAVKGDQVRHAGSDRPQ